MERAEELIARWIEDDPRRPGPANARLVRYGVNVWALIVYWKEAEGNVDLVIRDYAVPEAAVQAAIAYYRRNPAVIDARIELNSSPVA